MPTHRNLNYLRRFSLVMVLGSILVLFGLFPSNVLGTPSTYAQVGTEIIVEVPTLTPPDNGDPCSSAWISYTNDRGYPAYLTANRQLGAPPPPVTNSGRWQPTLPFTGEYRVEALIPNHTPIQWPCPPAYLSGDTSSARYTITHAGGNTLLVLDQFPHTSWADIGTYTFTAGSEGSVHLSDETNEPTLNRTVSFSAMRFTLVSVPPSPTPPLPTATPTAPATTPTPTVPDTRVLYLPLILKGYQPSPCLNREIEPNNASVNAFQHLPLCQSVELAGTMPSGDSADYYRIVLSSESVVTIDLFAMSPGSDFDLYLYDANLTQLAVSSTNGNANERIGPQLLASGNYYVRIHPDPTETGGTRTYRLRWTR